MKAKIIITQKKAVVDPQGKAVQNALEHMGYNGINAVHVGKYLEIELNGADRETARKRLDEACHKFLSNPVIEDYELQNVATTNPLAGDLKSGDQSRSKSKRKKQ